MSERRTKIIDLILAERERQFNLHGSELDIKNTPNDWVAITTSYLSDAASRKHSNPSSENFSEDFIKAAAVIVAALEHLDVMKSNDLLD